MQYINSRLTAVFIALHLLVVFSGCAGNRNNVDYQMEQMPANQMLIPQSYPQSSVGHEGSLWQADSQLNNLFVAIKARRFGDIVTVKIEESAKATNKAKTETERNSSLEAGIQKLFGLEDWWTNEVLPDIPSDLPKLTPFGNPSVKGNMKSTFEGDGETSRSGTLSAYITCRVVDVMANGNLKIVGTREVMVNHENQLIILSGVIRPRDISEDNIVDSRFISHAKIAYSGSGVIDDRQRPGWLANLLNNLWPF